MIFGRKPTITEELSAYAAALLELSAKNAEELRLEYKFPNESTALVMTQIIGFSLINLRRQFAANGVDDSVFGKCALSITENMANIMIDDASNRPAFLSFFQDKI